MPKTAQKKKRQVFKADIVRQPAHEVIQRAYLLKKLRRMKAAAIPFGEHERVDTCDELIAWIKGERVRTKRAGGLGD